MNPIVLLSQEHLPAVVNIIRNVIEDLETKGIHQWDEIYPDLETFEHDVQYGCLYGWIESGALLAVMTLDENKPAEYNQIQWEKQDSHSLIIHRLAVMPVFQHKGIAGKMVAFAEKLAKDRSYDSVKLDVFALNQQAYALYLSLGYVEKGSVVFRKGEFICLEKKIERGESNA